MSLFDSLGKGGNRQTQPANPAQMMQQLQANPSSFLKGVGLNIPDGMNDPQQMVNYLMQSGQIGPTRFRQAQQMLMGRK